jgi:hypothetical protein
MGAEVRPVDSGVEGEGSDFAGGGVDDADVEVVDASGLKLELH